MEKKKKSCVIVAIAVVVLIIAIVLLMIGRGVNITQVGLPEAATIIKGETLQLEVEYGTEKEATDEKIAEAAAKLTLVWASSDESIVTVDETGLATAIAAGEADITVSVQDTSIQSVCHVTVTVPLERIEAPEELELVINGEDTKELGAKLIPEDATSVVLVYESSDESVATVDKDGNVAAVGNGECIITTTVVSEDAAEPKSDDSSGYEPEGQAEKPVADASSEAEVAEETEEPDEEEIDPEMNVTPDSWIAETRVTVKTAPTDITLEATEGILTVGSTYNVKANIVPDDASDELTTLTWTSSDEDIATVDENGKVTANAAGTATITVSTKNGKSAKFELTVQEKPAKTNSGSSQGNASTSSGGTGQASAPSNPAPVQNDPAPAPSSPEPAPTQAPETPSNPTPDDNSGGTGANGDVMISGEADKTDNDPIVECDAYAHELGLC